MVSNLATTPAPTTHTIELWKQLQELHDAIDCGKGDLASHRHMDILMSLDSIDLQTDSLPEFDLLLDDGRSLLEHAVLACERAAESRVMPRSESWHGHESYGDWGDWSLRLSMRLSDAGMSDWALDRLVMAYSRHGLIDIHRCDLKSIGTSIPMSAVDMAISVNCAKAAAAFIKAGASLFNVPNRPIKIQVKSKTTVDIKPGELQAYIELMVSDPDDLAYMSEVIRARRAQDAAAAMNEQIARAVQPGDRSNASSRPPRRLSI